MVSPGRILVEHALKIPAAAEAGNLFSRKILLAAGLADSRTDAERKIKAGAVEIDGAKHTALTVDLPPGNHVFRVGKQWRRVRF